MKKTILFVLLTSFCIATAACSSNKQAKNDEQYQRKKIYLTEEDYMEDLAKDAAAERREAKPNTESEYIFELQPETQKNVYFFDERVRPMIPGEPSDREYKNTKRLWEKPKRYSPEQYYGNQAAEASPAATQEEDSYNYAGYDYN